MRVPSISQVVPLFFRLRLPRVCSPVVFSRTAVQFTPIVSHTPSSQLTANCTNSLKFFRGLSVSCPASFRVTSCICIDSEHDTKVGWPVGCTAEPVSAVKSKMSQAERMKRAVKEYGATVIVFHTCISLFTLGVSYAAVSSGVDVVGLLGKLGVGQSFLESKIATGAGTFVVAYAVHKLFAPARMATTLAATPLIVRYLRRIGFLKQAVSKI